MFGTQGTSLNTVCGSWSRQPVLQGGRKENQRKILDSYCRLTHLRSAIKHKSNVLLYILHLQILHYVTLLISSSYKIHHCHHIRVNCTVQYKITFVVIHIIKDFLPYYRLYNKYSFVYGICSKGLQRKLEYTKKRFTWKSSTRDRSSKLEGALAHSTLHSVQYVHFSKISYYFYA